MLDSHEQKDEPDSTRSPIERERRRWSAKMSFLLRDEKQKKGGREKEDENSPSLRDVEGDGRSSGSFPPSGGVGSLSSSGEHGRPLRTKEREEKEGGKESEAAKLRFDARLEREEKVSSDVGLGCVEEVKLTCVCAAVENVRTSMSASISGERENEAGRTCS